MRRATSKRPTKAAEAPEASEASEIAEYFLGGKSPAQLPDGRSATKAEVEAWILDGGLEYIMQNLYAGFRDRQRSLGSGSTPILRTLPLSLILG
jgi:hypothetical protein